MPEEWKPIAGYEGLYEVSSFGRVRSLDRWIDSRRPGWLKARLHGKILKPSRAGKNYLKVILSREGVIKGYLVHILVLEAFRGPAPAGMVGCHDKGLSNDLSNLRWDTPSNNVRDTHGEDGKRVSRKGVLHAANEYVFDNLPDEEWVPVLGYEGLYEVSNMGRVKSLDRLVKSGNRTLQRRGHLKKLSPIDGGYQTVGLSKDGHNTNRLVHVVVLEAFKGPRPDGHQGCHGEQGVAVNCLDNLRWDTPTNNNYDQVKHGTHRGTAKVSCVNGHEYTDENTIISSTTGSRKCRRCDNDGQRRRYAARRDTIAS